MVKMRLMHKAFYDNYSSSDKQRSTLTRFIGFCETPIVISMHSDSVILFSAWSILRAPHTHTLRAR